MGNKLANQPTPDINGTDYRPVPGILSWNLTSNCNQNCVHCYLDASTSSIKGTLFDTSLVKKVAIEAKNAGIQIIFLSGGEPLLLGELPAFIKIIRDVGLQPHICTNLTLLTKEKALELKNAGLERISVGIDQVDQELYEEFRAPNSFNSLISSLALCRDLNLNVNIDYTLTRKNHAAIEKIHEFALKYGCSQVSLKRYVQAGRGRTNADFLALDPLLYRQALCKWAINAAEYHQQIKSFVHDPFFNVLLYELNSKNFPDNFLPSINGCKAGGIRCGWLGISPDGSIHPCPLLRTISLGNVFDCTLEEALHSKLNAEIAFMTPKSCENCEVLSICRGGCRAAFMQTEGHLRQDTMCWRQFTRNH